MARRTAIALILLLLLAAAARTTFFTGLQVGDDIVYSQIAVDRLNGKSDIGSTQQTRSGFLLPIVAAYALFGAGEGPLVLYNLLCSVAMTAVVFLFSRRLHGDLAACVSGLVAALHPNLVHYATECHTDTPVALWLALAVLVFHSALDADPGARRRILSGLLLGWAYLHKESVVYMGLFFAGHAIATRRPWRWYLPVALPLMGVFILELIGFASLTGNPLERYAQIRRWHSGQYMAEHYRTLGSILYRQFLELPLRLFTPVYGRYFMSLINLAGLVAGVGLLRKRAPGAGLVAGWFLALFAGYCFWPSSLRPFLPGFFLFDWTLPVFGAPLAILAGMGAAQRGRGTALAGMAAAALLCLLTLHFQVEETRAMTAGTREARAWLATTPVSRVVSDEKTLEALDFFEGHRPSRRYVAFKDATDFEGAAVIVDKFWTRPGQWWTRAVPDLVRNPPASWRKVHDSERVVIYRP